jgi:hypothetical protein
VCEPQAFICEVTTPSSAKPWLVSTDYSTGQPHLTQTGATKGGGVAALAGEAAAPLHKLLDNQFSSADVNVVVTESFVLGLKPNHSEHTVAALNIEPRKLLHQQISLC